MAKMIKAHGWRNRRPVIRCLSGNTFEMSVTHSRKDNKEEYSKVELMMIAKVDSPDDPYRERTLDDLVLAPKGKFVACNVQYRDKKTDILVCDVLSKTLQNGSDHLNNFISICRITLQIANNSFHFFFRQNVLSMLKKVINFL